MSRIKDLYAIENGIEDLMPVDQESTIGEMIQKRAKMLLDVIELAEKRVLIKEKYLKEQMSRDASYGVEMDDIHERVVMENFTDLCTSYADEMLGEIIEEEHLDLDYIEYEHTVKTVGEFVENRLGEYAEALIKVEQC